MVAWYHRTKLKCFISISMRPISIKLGTVVTKVKGLQLTKSHASLILRSRDVTWQNKNIISPLQPDRLASKLAQYWLRLRTSHLPSHIINWSFSHVISRENRFISTSTRSISIKQGLVLTLVEGLPLTKSHACLILRSRDKITTLYLHSHETY